MFSRFFVLVSIVVILTCGCTGEVRTPILETSTKIPTSTSELIHLPVFTSTVEASPTTFPSETHQSSPTSTPTETATPFFSGPFLPVIPGIPFPNGVLSILGEHPDGQLLLESEGQIISLYGGSWEIYLPEFQGEPLGVDSEGRFWILDPEENRISSWDGIRWHDYTESDGWLSTGERIWSKTQLVTDQLGQIWFVINDQLWVFADEQWVQVSLSDYGVSHPLESDEGLLPSIMLSFVKVLNELWLGTCYWTGSGPIGGGGVLRFDGVIWRQVDTLVSSGCTEAIVEDHAGNVWIGLNGNLMYLDQQDRTWMELGLPASPFGDSSRFFGIHEITFDPENNPWAEFLLCGGAGCGFGPILYRFQNGTWVEIIREGFQYDRQMVFDNSGTPWLFTPAGIFNVTNNDLEDVIELAVNPRSIFEDTRGGVWFLVEDNEYPLWYLPPDI